MVIENRPKLALAFMKAEHQIFIQPTCQNFQSSAELRMLECAGVTGEWRDHSLGWTPVIGKKVIKQVRVPRLGLMIPSI